MFQFFRRVSGSLLPRPDRPWREDATSHAPTIGRKRRYSLTDRDVSDSPPSTAKRTKNDLPKPDTECDAKSEADSTNGDAQVLSVERRDMKEVTKGVKEVNLEDQVKAEDSLPILPEGIPLPDSPSASPEPESESPELPISEVLEETKDEEHPGREDSVASSSPQDDVEEGVEDSGKTEVDCITTNTDTSADGVTHAQEVAVPTVESGLHETLEVKE